MHALRAVQTCCGTIAVMVAVAAADSAQADEVSESVTLEYHAPAACPDAAEFVRRVREKTTRFYPVAPELGSRLFIVTVDGAAPSRGQLAIRGGKSPQAERAVEGDTCDEVVSALALATALAVDPRSALGPSSEPLPPLPPLEVEEQQPKPVEPPAPKEVPPPAELRAPIVQPKPTWGLGAHALVAPDVAPNPLIGPGMWLELKSRPDHKAMVYQFAIEHAWSKEADRSGVPIDFSRTLFRLGVCPFTRAIGTAEAVVCGHASAGVLRGSTLRVPGATDDTRFWGAAGASVQLRFPLARSFALAAGGGFDVSFERDWYVYRPDTELHRVAPVSGFATAGFFYSLR